MNIRSVKRRKYLWLLIAYCWSCAAEGPVFDVASVKLNTSQGDTASQVRIPPGGRVTAANATLRALITTAYQIQDFDLEGGPGWVATDRYDIEAKGIRLLRSRRKSYVCCRYFWRTGSSWCSIRSNEKEKPIFTLTASPGVGPRLEFPHDECNARFVQTAPSNQLHLQWFPLQRSRSGSRHECNDGPALIFPVARVGAACY